MYQTTQLTIFVFTLLLGSRSVIAQQAPDLTGRWKDSANPDRQLDLYQKANGTFDGKIANDRTLKAKDGTIVFRDLSWNEKGKSYQGTLIDPDHSITVPIAIQVKSLDEFECKAKRLFLSRTFRFERIR